MEMTNQPKTISPLVAAFAGIYLIITLSLVIINIYYGEYNFASGVLNGVISAYAVWLLYNRGKEEYR